MTCRLFLFIVTLAAALGAVGNAQARALHADPYAAHPDFNDGEVFADAFAGGFDHNYAAFRGARITGSDDVVVVGLVPAAAGGVSGNIGLVRYSAEGERLVWSAAMPPLAHNGGQYLIYPNAASARFTAVSSIRVIGDRIAVLVDREFAAGDRDVHVLLFSDSGQLLSDTRAFGASADEAGAGLEVWSEAGQTHLATVVTRTLGGVSQPQFRRYRLNVDGTLSANGLVATYSTFPCDIRSCTASSTALGRRGGRVYIGGSVLHSGTDSDFFALAVDLAGAVDASFGNGGLVVVPFDQPLSDRRDWLTRIDVQERQVGPTLIERLVLVGEVAQRCRTGIGVVRLSGDGAPVAGFGTSGKVVIGGSDAAPGVACSVSGAQYARAVSLGDQRILIAGYSVRRALCDVGQACEEQVDGSIASVHPQTGQSRTLSSFVYPLRDSTVVGRQLHSGFWDLVPDQQHVGQAIVLGDLRFMDNGATPPTVVGKKLFATLRVQPDRLFGHGME